LRKNSKRSALWTLEEGVRQGEGRDVHSTQPIRDKEKLKEGKFQNLIDEELKRNRIG
jgi:hypothetical protein